MTITQSFSVVRVRRAFSSAALLASLLTGPAVTLAAEDAPIGSAQTTVGLTRAEVIADLNLWRRAGVDRHEELARFYQVDVAAYEQAVAEYQRLRNGPAYAAELARVQGHSPSSVQAAR